MQPLLNTLYVTTQGAYLAKSGLAVQVRLEEKGTRPISNAHARSDRLFRPRRGVTIFSWGRRTRPASPSRFSRKGGGFSRR